MTEVVAPDVAALQRKLRRVIEQELRGVMAAAPPGIDPAASVRFRMARDAILAAALTTTEAPEPVIDEAMRVVRGAGYVVHADEGECYAIAARCPTCGRHDCPGRYQWADCTTSEAELLAQADNAEEERGDAR